MTDSVTVTATTTSTTTTTLPVVDYYEVLYGFYCSPTGPGVQLAASNTVGTLADCADFCDNVGTYPSFFNYDVDSGGCDCYDDPDYDPLIPEPNPTYDCGSSPTLVPA